MNNRELLNIAKKVRKNAYAPYSGFSVGAALLCEDGSVYVGCNVENASYTPTCCAERVAIFSAIADGKRDFCSIAVAADKAECMPCGVCRQVMSEFCSDEFLIIYESSNGEAEAIPLCELLPNRFTFKKDLEKK